MNKKKTYYTEPEVLEGSGPFAFVGDIHGCFDEMIELEDEIKAKYSEVKFISLGDLVDRGPLIHEVVKHCRDNDWKFVIGNHDEKMVRWANGNKVRLAAHHIETTKVLTTEDIEYFKNGAYFIRIPHYNLIAVHGGLWPGKPPEVQNPKHMIRLGKVNPESKQLIRVEEQTSEDKHWSDYWKGPEQVVYGHSAYKEVHLDDEGWTIGIDTGCVYGNKLTALVVFTNNEGERDLKFHQVNAKKAYFTKKHGWY